METRGRARVIPALTGTGWEQPASVAFYYSRLAKYAIIPGLWIRACSRSAGGPGGLLVTFLMGMS